MDMLYDFFACALLARIIVVNCHVMLISSALLFCFLPTCPHLGQLIYIIHHLIPHEKTPFVNHLFHGDYRIKIIQGLPGHSHPYLTTPGFLPVGSPPQLIEKHPITTSCLHNVHKKIRYMITYAHRQYFPALIGI